MSDKEEEERKGESDLDPAATEDMTSGGVKAAPEMTVQYQVPYYVLDAEYAIGMGIISQQEYTSLRDDYYTQARTLTGVAIPLIGLMFYMWLGTTQRWGCWPYIFLLLLTVGAVFSGLDRLHKFYSELQMLIIGHYIAKKLAEKAAADAAAKNITKSYLEKELKKEFDNQLEKIKKLLKHEDQQAKSENPGTVIPVSRTPTSANPGGIGSTVFEGKPRETKE
jgi:hypothetical protein